MMPPLTSTQRRIGIVPATASPAAPLVLIKDQRVPCELASRTCASRSRPSGVRLPLNVADEPLSSDYRGGGVAEESRTRSIRRSPSCQGWDATLHVHVAAV